MEYLDIVKEGLGVLIIPILTAVAGILVSLLNKAFDEWKRKNEWEKLDSYIEEVEQAVVDAVYSVHQTMVEGIKGTDEWTEEYQKKVLKEAIRRVKLGLRVDAIQMLRTLYNDLDGYLNAKIEAELADLKLRQVQDE